MNTPSANIILATHSKSFNLAARLLSPKVRKDSAILYAWCRRADDLIDLDDAHGASERLQKLRREVASIYAGEPQSDELLGEFQSLVRCYHIQKAHPLALLAGFEMDIGQVRLWTIDELLLYSYRVAGVVGLMMCPILGVTDARAFPHAVHLGIAMQLTNICRDVAEDWGRARLYLPEEMLAQSGYTNLGEHLSGPLPAAARAAVTRVVRQLLDRADAYYASGDDGLRYIPGRAAVAIRAARSIYSAIGTELSRRHWDPFKGRAAVPLWKKLALLVPAVGTQLGLFVQSRARARERIRAKDADQAGESTSAIDLTEGVINGAFLPAH